MDAKYFHRVLSKPQLQMLHENLLCIAERRYGVYDIKLCKVHETYYEIFYVRHELIIEQILSYDTDQIFEQYLNEIDISDLFTVVRAVEN